MRTFEYFYIGDLTMQNTVFMPKKEVLKMDICSICANADTCDYVRHTHKTIWECELFEPCIDEVEEGNQKKSRF